ncbi:fumarate reductase subunit A [Aminivibrio sp.]
MKERDVIVIGAGGAGLTAALAAREKGAQVLLLSKTGAGNANCTALSGGGFSLAAGRVTPEDHFRRVREIGRFVNEDELVMVLADRGEESLLRLKTLGVTISIHSGGHASVRDTAPSEIAGGAGFTRELAALARGMGVKIIENAVATRLLLEDGGAAGVEWIDWKTGRGYRKKASSVILASGGGGRIFPRTDNPARMTGDGYFLALDAGIDLVDMEYVQFYPLGWDQKGYPLWMVGLDIIDFIPLTDEHGREYVLEALRSWGIKNGREGNYVGRDKTAILIDRHEREGGTTLLHLEKLREEDLHDPYITMSLMIDLPPGKRTAPVKVSPIQHYFSGGIPIDGEGRTALPGLYACGEVTGGVDGASRMGGNALTNIVTFGFRAGSVAAAEPFSGRGGSEMVSFDPAFPDFSREGGEAPSEVRRALGEAVARGLGPCRTGEGIARCLQEIAGAEERGTLLKVNTPMDLLHALEMKGLFATAKSVAAAALLREESRGVQYREDFPGERPEWKRQILCRKEGNAVTARPGKKL